MEAVSILVKLRFCLLFLFVSSLPAYATENYHVDQMSADEAYAHGALLRAQFKTREARQYLKYAADKGHADAAYLYAMDSLEYRHSARVSEHAQQYLEQAAEGRSLFALNYIYQSGDWVSRAKRNNYQNQYFNLLIELGATQPGRAFLLLSEYFHHSDPELSNYYLSKARAFELPQAEMTYASRLEHGDGDYFFDSSRNAAIRDSYFTAASEGYIPATKKYVALLEQQGNFEQALQWREKALAQGDVTSLVTLARIYSGQSTRYSFVSADLAKAKAYLEHYLETAGKDRLLQTYEKVEQDYKDIIEMMSAPQLAQADQIKQELVNQPPFYHHDYLWLENTERVIFE